MKFLFFSPHTLADSSSGAARSVDNLLGELKRQGHACAAVTGSLVDARNDLFEQVLQTQPVDTLSVVDAGASVPVRRVVLQGVEHLIATFGASTLSDVRAPEEMALYKMFIDVFHEIEPDVVITFGTMASNTAAGLYARQSGRKSALYVASATYTNREHFIHASHIVTVSHVMARKLDAVTQLPKLALPPFIHIDSILCAQRTPEYITFINPAPYKGLVLVAEIVKECAKRGRPYKFLFVESRGTRETVAAQYPELFALPSFFMANNVHDVRQVYARTAIILYPSVCFEAAGQVSIEANANGIPVLAHNVGGIAETLGGAGYLFDPPADSLTNFNAPIPQSTVDQWLDVIDRLHNDPAELKAATARAQAAAQRYNLSQHATTFAKFCT